MQRRGPQWSDRGTFGGFWGEIGEIWPGSVEKYAHYLGGGACAVDVDFHEPESAKIEDAADYDGGTVLGFLVFGLRFWGLGGWVRVETNKL